MNENKNKKQRKERTEGQIQKDKEWHLLILTHLDSIRL